MICLNILIFVFEHQVTDMKAEPLFAEHQEGP